VKEGIILKKRRSPICDAIDVRIVERNFLKRKEVIELKIEAHSGLKMEAVCSS
jgi:hypothetical protein